MRKLYLFFAVLCSLLGAQTANAANFEGGKTYYLKIVDACKSDNARFAAYFYGNGTAWYDMEYVYGESLVLKVTLPSSVSYSSVIFCRMDGSNSTNSWDYRWNQTGNITSRSGNMYSVTDVNMNGSGWGTYCYYLMGDFNNWTASSTYKLTDNEYGVFSLDEVSFSSATTGELKVKSSVDTWYGLNSSSFTFSESSSSTAGLSANVYAGGSYNIPYDLPSKYSVNYTLGSSSDKLSFTKTSSGDDSGDDDDDDSGDDSGAYSVYKIVLLRGDGNGNYATTEVGTFTQDADNPWFWTLSTSVNKNDDKSTDEKYRYRVYLTETEYVDYSTDANNNDSYLGESYSGGLYEISSSTASFCMNLTYAYFGVTLYDGVLYTTKVSGSAISASDMTDPTPDPEVDETSELVNMPLKKADFADGKAHYFVVGTRMSEWRLQPEWELLDTDGDGTYTLANRLLYTGMMGIAKVESYDDYIHQRYTFYSYNTNVTGDKELTLTTKTNPNASLLAVTCAESTNKFTAVNYGKSYTKGQFTSSNTIIWGSSLTEDGIRLSQPTYVGTISIKDNGDNGLTLTFSDSSSDASVIANYRTFSLVGSAVVNVDYNSDETCRTPLRNDGSGPTDWQEAWIQYDNYGKPYYDAYGNSLYQTVFQREWLANHPTIFKAEDGFEYNSLNIVFNYDASQTHSATIPATGEYGWATDNGSVTSPNKSYSVTNNDGWQCFVVENMWLGEQFKIWTGWGGADKTQDGSGIGSGDARWNYENGGHHTGADWTISADKTIYYGTDRDINKADFDLGDRIFARYVKVWWNPSKGFDGSFLQLITEVGGPEISCARADKHALQYTWTVPNAATQLANYDVKNIKIVRYRLDSNKNETSIVISDVAYAQGDLNGADITTVAVKDQLDPNYAEGGYYWYNIVIDYYGNSTAEEKSDFSRDAESNRVYIYYDVIPDAATVKQLVYTTADGTPENGTRVDDDAETKYYSFDLAVNASAPASLIDATYTKDGETVDVLSLVKYYVVGVPNPNSNLYIDYSDNATLLTASDLSAWTDLNFSTDYTYFGLTPDKDNNYVMPEFVLYNVIPGKFYVATGNNFTVDMISEDGDASAWAAYNVTTAKPQTTMTVPTTSYSVEYFTIDPIETSAYYKADDADTNMPYGASDAQPVSYKKLNKLMTKDGQILPLMVTNSVLNAWDVTYGLNATIGGYTVANTKTYNKSKLNVGVDADFDYLPMAYSIENASKFNIETGISAIDNLTFRKANEETLNVDMTVSYTRTSDDVVVDDLGESKFDVIIKPYEEGNVDNVEYLLAYDKATLTQLTIHNQGAWSSTTSNGNVIYFLDAFEAIKLNNADKTLNKGVGYYSSNGHSSECEINYYKATTNAGYQPIEVVEGGEVHTGADFSDPFNVLYNADYRQEDAENNFSVLAAQEDLLTIKIGHVGDSEEGQFSSEEGESAETVYTAIGMLYTVLTAEYPFLVNPTYTATVSTLSDDNTASVVSLSYPVLLSTDGMGTTTDIDDIAADVAGDFRIWPNPADNVVNVAASAALGTVEIYAVDGRLVKTVEVDDTHAALEVSDLVKGTYIIRAAGASQRMIKK